MYVEHFSKFSCVITVLEKHFLVIKAWFTATFRKIRSQMSTRPYFHRRVMFPKTYINTPASRAHIHPTTRQNNAVHELVLHDTKHIPCLIVQPRVATCPPVSSQLLTIGLNLLSLFFAEKTTLRQNLSAILNDMTAHADMVSQLLFHFWPNKACQRHSHFIFYYDADRHTATQRQDIRHFAAEQPLHWSCIAPNGDMTC